MDASIPTTLTDLLDARAAGASRDVAYTFLADGELDARTLSFAGLAARARRVAAAMLAQGQPGGRALLLYPPGLEFLVGFFACLYARVVAVPAYPPHRKAELRRLQAIIGDAAPAFVLTTAAMIEPIRQGFGPHGAAISWIASDAIANDTDAAPAVAIATGDLAFLQYTSGSTGAPRGVMLSHANLLHNAALVHAAVEQQPGDRYVSWLPTFHDMGFMAGVLAPLYGGLPCVQLAPQAFLERPLRWLQAISRHRGTTSGAPNFAYELCLRRVTDRELAELDLSSWTVAFDGAEPVRADTLRRFAARFGAAGFRAETLYPCYGLAEATLMVTGSFKGRPAPTVRLDADAMAAGRAVDAADDAARGVTLVGCGRSLAGQELAIVDPETLAACGPAQIGEIWLRGGSVASGYWNRPDETAATFGARIAGSGRGPYLRTGDLGFLRGDQLFIAGRHKDLLILRGRNHYPQDLELTVERCHPALRPGCGAAFSIDVAGEERLVIVSEVKRGPDGDADAIFQAVFGAIRRALAEGHELAPHAIALIAQGSIHKTSSGKIQRRASRAAFLDAKLDLVAAWTAAAAAAPEPEPEPEPDVGPAAAIAGWLVDEVARRAGVPAASIDAHQPLASYGLDSLAAVELAHGIQSRFGVSVSATELLSGLSVAAAARRAQPVTAPSAAASPTGALSTGQRALWLLQQIEPSSTAYTIARAVRVRGADPARLAAAFDVVIRRHAALRTRFPIVHGEPVREELAHDPRVFRAIAAADWSEAALDRAIEREAAAPFDLAEGPVMRVCHFDRGAEPAVLLIAVHHIVADFWSLVIVLRELGAIYAASRLGLSVSAAPERVGFGDVVAWQDARLRGDDGARLRAHWKQALAPGCPPLELPADLPHRRGGSLAASQAFAIDGETTGALRRLAAQHGATLFHVGLAIWHLLLHRLTGATEITVGTPTSGRDRAELAGVVGYLANIVPVRAELAAGLRFTELLEQVRASALAAVGHAACPFPIIVEMAGEASGARRAAGAPPLVQTLFAFQKPQADAGEPMTRLALGLAGAQLTVGDLALESLAAPARIAELALALSLGEAGDGLLGALEYDTGKLTAATIAAWLDALDVLVRAVAADPSARIDELPVLSDAAHRALAGFERLADPVAGDARPLHVQLAARAAQAPDAVAVYWRDQQLSRGALDRDACRIAHQLRAAGVAPEARIGICLTRSPRMVAAMIAAWKCGAAYVPLDPTYPPDRLRFLVDDSAAEVVLTERACRAALDGCRARVICLDDVDLDADAAAPAEHPVTGAAAAYVIYTSGSTGVPKGVVIEHRQAASLVAWAAQAFSAEELRRVLAATSTCFDLSIFELWVPLCTGGAIVLADSVLAWWTEAQRGAAPAATLVNTVPSALAAALELGPVPAGVATINLAGEVLEPALVEATFAAAAAPLRLYNLYGPSETTTYSSFTAVRPGAPVTIGGPVGATTLTVVDAHHRRVPIGSIGELVIGGPGVARGYWNRPALTAERFLPAGADAPGARSYVTGDRARWRADGQLEFLGRRDHQVKVRGYRIELSEIASVLGAHPAVLEAVAVVRGAGRHARVVAYVALRGGAHATVETLTSHVQARLPRFMVPAPIVVLDRLPRTGSGKLDRAALPAPPDGRAALRPPSELEAVVAGVWADALGVAAIGVDDDLFALGAHSLLFVTVRARLEARLGVSLPFDQVLGAPTVATIAAAIAVARDARPPIPRIPRATRAVPRSDDE